MIYFKRTVHLGLLLLFFLGYGCQNKKKNIPKKSDTEESSTEEFPSEMVGFIPYENNPVFSGADADTWDKNIRERGYILLEDGKYKMWYSGYKGEESDPKYLGYATSTDGINWERYDDNPIYKEKWTEDIFVIREDGQYYMFAEGENDIAHLLISQNGIDWQEKGDLIIRKKNGDRISGPYGTPTVWIEDGKWYLFYERDDQGIWLANSEDQITWTNVQDEPVLEMGPEKYDAGAVAANQVVKFNNRYYLFYHGSTNPNWADPNENALWSSLVAMSTDLINWKKYPKNPIVEGDHSSPILVLDDEEYRLFTMHDKVWLYYPAGK